MKSACDEKLVKVINVKCQGNGRSKETKFELGISYVVNNSGKPTGEIRLRTEQTNNGMTPVVTTLNIEAAQEFITGFDNAILFAKRGKTIRKI